MRTRIWLLPLVLLVSTIATIPVAAWIPVSCDERAQDVEAIRERVGQPIGYQEAWRLYEQQVRKAKPGDHKYVPHPFPQMSVQVFSDFRHGFLHRFVASPSDVGSWQRKTYDLLQNGAVKYEVERVENWNPHRCAEHEHLTHYHLVRIYDESGREVSRAAVDESGMLSIFAELDGQQGPLDDLTRVREVVRQRFGVDTKPTHAQYATLDGPPAWCSPIMPCVVFRSEGEIFIVNHDFYLFKIEPGASRLGILENALRPIDPRGVSLNAGRESTPWITVGYEWWEGRLVAIGPRGGPLD